ncbi:hypothetical protein R5R35_009870 [Gryllus longicercus]|uniref:Dynein regulatory complex protein 10 n=1 Tax=Gryllus longicercus TaxID=2509291 RepID=A0AAN9Z733_9ORTH
MVMEWKSSQMRQMALEQELQDLEDHLKTLRENNHKAESDMRTRRTKLERQLEAIIASYDSDMSERQAELDQLTQELEDERRALAELQTQLREQEEDYEQLLAERSEEEEAHFQRQLWTFLTNRAARVIQRGWREHLVRKAARRKAKGKGKGKDKKKK